MSCKFKGKYDNCKTHFCKVTGGECQFEKSPYDDNCAILKAYIDLKINDDNSTTKLNWFKNATHKIKALFKKS